MASKFPTMGYRKDGQAAIFDLAQVDAPLPTGWDRDPGIIEDAAKRTAEAISEKGVLLNPEPRLTSPADPGPNIAKTK